MLEISGHSVRQDEKVRQQVFGTLGRLDELKASGRLEALKERCPAIKEVRVKGAMIGVELTIDGGLTAV